MMRPPPAAFIARERRVALARSRRAVATEREAASRHAYRDDTINEALLDFKTFLVIVAAILMVAGPWLAFSDWLAS